MAQHRVVYSIAISWIFSLFISPSSSSSSPPPPAQTERSLEKLSAQEKAVSSTGDTLAQTEQAIGDLENLETKAPVSPFEIAHIQRPQQTKWFIAMFYHYS